MGLLDTILGKVDVVVSDFNFNQKSKKPCTEEEKAKMLEILKGYDVLDKEETKNRPVDFGSVLNIGTEMKKILSKKRINPTCYLKDEEDQESKPIKEKSVDRNGECTKNDDCKGDLVCDGYIKNLSKGKCLDARHDIIDMSSIISATNKCDTQYDCSINSQCGVQESTFGSKKQCIAFNFPLTDDENKFYEKIIMYSLV